MATADQRTRIRAALDAALERLRHRPADRYAALGESLFWLVAVAEVSGRQGEPVILGLRWARNRVAHGHLVTAPTRTVPGSEPGMLVLGRSMLGTVTTYRWLPRSSVPVVGTPRRSPAQDRAYDSEVAGGLLMEPIDRALTLL